MVQKAGSVKYKVIAGYLLLFTVAVFSVWLLYTQILKIAKTGETGEDNKKIIRISNTIADLYASEALGRSSILTGAEKDYNAYTRLIDSINTEIGSIKADVDPTQVSKFDSIQLLLTRKKNSVTEIIRYRKSNPQEKAFRRYISSIYNVKDSIISNVKPVRQEKKHEWQELVTSLLTRQQLDSLSKLPVSNDSLAMAFENVLSNLLVKDNRLKYELYRKEQELLEENRIISDQIRVILASVENEFLQNSYNKIEESRTAIEKTINTVAWAGAATLLLLIVFAWIILSDLTKSQNYRKQLELLNQENEELLRSKSMLMATVTHDLQTPLGSIIGFYELIKNSGINPKQQQYLKNIKESADYILRLVNDLLDFSKLENNRITIEKVSFNMKDSIEGTCKILEPIALNKNIELNWDIAEELDDYFITDPYRIKQVLTNLISNSIKFTHEGSVEVTAKKKGDSIKISVIDTGIGIAKDKHEDVFREFTQAHKGIEKKFGGTGLGLTISKRILELLDGKIELRSEEGQGSVFTVTIPCIQAKKTESQNNNVAAADTGRYLADKKILIIDDDRVQLTLMTELFSNYPLLVKTEINSSSAISLLEKETFDLLLTDIQMPVLDGFELVQHIRKHDNPVIANIPVIALSGRRDLTAEDFKQRGFTAHHPKPIQFEALVALISAIFGNKDITPLLERSQKTEALPLYNLRSLLQFTNNDPESLKTILRTFIDSAVENCDALKEAIIERDEVKLSATAHKMIPMLKQMEVHSIANLLVPLEEGTHGMQWEELETYIQGICDRLNGLALNFNEEIIG